ncbi:MAG TPA: carboxypeptidase regulatory-like domain-containing protein [Gemmatimonadales bacterium]|nr:carboxypeptidase regulatory-like domain-containing protein [Gemmatimonadales bacterium]
MDRTTRIMLLAIALHALAAPRPLRSQEPGPRGTATVRGVVLAGPGEPVPYAVVAMPPRFTQRFTDETGAFAFTRIPAGTYRLQARQVGFKPVDTTVVVAANQTVAVTVTIERLTVRLEEITVVATRGCTQPGPPDAGTPELAALFDQIGQFARQYKLLATTYQFRYRMIRTFSDLNEVGNVEWTRRDTAEYVSSAIAQYRPGDVVGATDMPDGTIDPAVRLPTITDIADSVFQANHCFSFTGRVAVGDTELVRFHFRPPDSLQAPDLAGDVDMDPRSYQVRRITVSLTHPERAWDKMRSATSTITFAELLPNVVVQRSVASMQVLAKPALLMAGAHYVARFAEDQLLLDTHFLRPLPGSQDPGP